MTITVNNLSLQIKNGKKIVSNLSFVLNDFDKLTVIGEEGNGKSTLLKYLYNSQDIEDYCEASGFFSLSKKEIGYLPQHLDLSWYKIPVLDFLLQDEINSEINYELYNDYNNISRLFADFNIKEILDENRLLGTCSGGERVKIGLVKILIRHPKLLLLDEPTNDLDLSSLKWLEDYLLNISIPLIFVTHDEALIRIVANQVLHLEQIKRKSEMRFTYFNGGYSDYIDQREKNFAQQELDHYRTKKEKETKRQVLLKRHQQVEYAQNQCVRNPTTGRLLAKKMKNVLSQEKKLEKFKVVDAPSTEDAINCFFENEIELPAKKCLLSIENVDITIGEKTLIYGTNLNLYGPGHIVITGDNGTGKTTLLKYIYNQLTKVSNITIGYMPQNYEDYLDFEQTPIQYFQETFGFDKEMQSKIMSYLGAMRYEDYEMTRKIGELSGGQKAKLYLLMLIMRQCNVLVLDEPTRNLSPLSNPKIRKILQDYHGAIIAVSHDRMFINEVGEQVYYIENQKLLKR